MKSRENKKGKYRGTSFFTGLLFGLSITSVSFAGPVGGEVRQGDVRFEEAGGGRLNVIQGSDKSVIHWQDFSINNGEHVDFQQPGRSSVSLNRVVGSNISQIHGRLTSNGEVYLINSNGIYFGKNAIVDVAGMLATTVDIEDRDFLNGKLNFNKVLNPAGRVVNEGSITAAEGGFVALVAPSVKNSGVINARLGKVALGSGNAFTVDLFGDELISFAVDTSTIKQVTGINGEQVDALLEQSGTINADGGVVALTVSDAKAVLDQAINLSGVVQARTVSQQGGKIVLSGGQHGTVNVDGTLLASGDQAGEQGGSIDVLGNAVNIQSKARINASGQSGGGTVLVGGDFQGRGNKARARRTMVAAGAEIAANALQQGDGGMVVVWSDQQTTVDGDLSAHGGQQQGNGGMVETSSAGKLSFSKPVDVTANNNKGKAGTWLVDPENIDIGSGEAASISSSLNAGGNVTIKTAEQGEGEGNISVNAPITKTEGPDAALSLIAHGTINVNQPISSEEGKLDVALRAGKAVKVNAKISTNGGNFSSAVNSALAVPTTNESIAETTEEDSQEVAETTGEVTEEAQGEADTEDGTTVAEVVANVEVNEPAEVQPIVQEQPVVSVDNNATSAGAPEKATPVSQVSVADTITTQGGSIRLDSGDQGVTTVSSKLDSSNTETGQVGGDIQVLGETVILTETAEIDASGDAGGGEVLIGGDYQGKGETRTATTTTVEKGATINADATTNGDGGQVIVWADDKTSYQGHISAKGGAEGGDGALVEVSGKKVLDYRGMVDTSAPNGDIGTLLLDPEFLNLIDAKGDPDPKRQPNTISWGRIIDDFGNTSILLQADGDITIKPFNANGVSTNEKPDGEVGRTVYLPQIRGQLVKFESLEGDIVFENQNNTFATKGNELGGADVEFEAHQGSLKLGDLYSYGGNIVLNSKEEIDLIGINSRVNPYRVLPIPQVAVRSQRAADEAGNEIVLLVQDTFFVDEIGDMFLDSDLTQSGIFTSIIGKFPPNAPAYFKLEEDSEGKTYYLLDLSGNRQVDQEGKDIKKQVSVVHFVTVNNDLVKDSAGRPVTSKSAELPFGEQAVTIASIQSLPSSFTEDHSSGGNIVIGEKISRGEHGEVEILNTNLIDAPRKITLNEVSTGGGDFTAISTGRVEIGEVYVGANRFRGLTRAPFGGDILQGTPDFGVVNTGAIDIVGKNVNIEKALGGDVTINALSEELGSIKGRFTIFSNGRFLQSGSNGGNLHLISGTHTDLNLGGALGEGRRAYFGKINNIDINDGNSINLGPEQVEILFREVFPSNIESNELSSIFVEGGPSTNGGAEIPLRLPSSEFEFDSDVSVVEPLVFPVQSTSFSPLFVPVFPQSTAVISQQTDALDNVFFVPENVPSSEGARVSATGKSHVDDENCDDSSRLALLLNATTSASQHLDFGRGRSTGASPKQTHNLFGEDNCFF